MRALLIVPHGKSEDVRSALRCAGGVVVACASDSLSLERFSAIANLDPSVTKERLDEMESLLSPGGKMYR